MSSKTKLIVLHMKELIYTGIFVVLGILFIVLLIIMFFPNKKENEASTPSSTQDTSYLPGVYTTSILLGDNAVDVEVVVDSDYITSIRLVNLDEAITTMYPLIQPTLEEIASQVYTLQTVEGVTYQPENKYTALVLLDAIQTALEKAALTTTTDSIE